MQEVRKPTINFFVQTLVLALGLSWPARMPAASLPSGFVEESIGGSWNEAVGLTFATDGRMFVWERGGTVWTVENGVKSATPFLDITEEVAVWNNYGLLGFCLHPDFLNNGHVYLLYVADRHHVRFHGTPNYDPGETETHVATIGRITRYTARASDGYRTIDPSSRKVLLGESLNGGFPLVSGQHGVGTILFGSDGTLLASCGDGASSSITDVGNGSGTYYQQALADGIIRPQENVGAYRCQMVDSLSGKIIRIDPTTGDGLASNPFFDPATPRAPRSRVWALGLKTPSRMTLRPGTGEHHPGLGQPGVFYIGDVGWNDWEDLNICHRPGMNFGWPAYEGMDIQPSYYSANVQNLDAPNPLAGTSGCSRQYFYFRELLVQDTLGTPSWPNPCNSAQQIPATLQRFVHARPVIDWKHGSGPARVATYSGTNASSIDIGASGSPVAGAQFGGACSMGGAWYTGTDFPAAYRNTYFHFDYEAEWIKCFVFDTNDVPVEVRNFASSAGGVVFLGTHPTEGSLYYITWTSTLRRIRYVGSGNQPPTAVASADRTFGPGPLSVQFTGANSVDPEALPLSYAWNFGDGSPVNTNANPIHVFAATAGVPTRYDVTLRVTDRSSASNQTALIISVNNTPPAVLITSPTNGTRYPMGGDSTWPCTATVNDAEHGPGQLSYAWQTFLHHNNHLHSEPVDTNQTTTTTLSPEGCDGQTYFYRLVLTVTDAAGLSATNEVRLHPDCTNAPAPPDPAPVVSAAPGLDPSLPPGRNFDLSHWYLGTPDSPQSLSIPAADLMLGHTSRWFYTGPDGAMVFWAPVTGGTTANSSYPRSELREQINPPDNGVNWDSFGTHLLEARCRVTRLPSTGKVIIGQIHSYLGDARPLLKLVYDNGTFDAQVKESPNDDPDAHFYFANGAISNMITYRIVLTDGLLSMTVNGVTRTVDIFDLDPGWSDQTYYFKAGSYCQDNSGSSTEGAQVEFYHLLAAHGSSAPVPPTITRQPASTAVPVGSNTVLSVSALGGLPLSYQWLKDGAPFGAPDNSILTIFNAQPGHDGLYQVIVTNTWGAATSTVARLTVLADAGPISLATALDTTDITWTTTGTPPWEGHYSVSYDGLDAARNGLLPDSQSSSLQATLAGPGVLTFWWKVSSETNADYLTFYLNSSQQARLSGEMDWQFRTLNVPAGSQVVRWTYSKNSSRFGGQDRGWVDQVQYRPQPVAITTQPVGRTNDAGTTVTFNVVATGTPPLTYRWQRQGSDLIESATIRGVTNATLTLSNVQPAQSGLYAVVVSNLAGSLISSNAALSVTPVVTLAEALDTTGLIWTTSGSPVWTGQEAVSRDNVDAARSGAIGHSGSTSMQTTMTGPGTLFFWWKVSSQTNNDLLRFYVGSTERGRISGEVDWRQFSYPVSTGQVVRWTYSKNSSTVAGQDRAWVDQVVFDPLKPPAAPTGLMATPASISQIRLSWTDNSSVESGFRVERSLNGTDFTFIGGVSSNVTTYLSTGLLAGTTYHYRVNASNVMGSSEFSLPAVTSTPEFVGAKINFQPASAPIPAGYQPDSGAVYGMRTNGLTYGWNRSNTSYTQDRNSSRSADQRYDTLVYSQQSGGGTLWEIAVPNGTYAVSLVAGDASTSSAVYRYVVEGVLALNGTATSANRWVAGSAIVNVSDGRLSVTNGAGSSNNRICFIDITRAGLTLVCAPNKTAACGSAWTFDSPLGATNACNGSNVLITVLGTVTNRSGFCGGSFAATRTWMAVDACGISNVCSQTVTVTDSAPPTLVCVSDKAAECGSPWTFDPPTLADDACAGTVAAVVLSTVTNRAGFCEGTFAVTRTWSATDGCGNSNTCSQTVTVLDTTAPSLVCATDKTAECGTSWTFNPPVATDGCSGVTVSEATTVTNRQGACGGTFSATRTWIVSDGCGNSGTCSQTVVVLDTTGPTLICAADKSAQCGDAWDFDLPTPSDACGGDVLLALLDTVTNRAGFCGGGFSATRTWSATDGCGNSNTCSQTVTVMDTTGPPMTCAANKTVECRNACQHLEVMGLSICAICGESLSTSPVICPGQTNQTSQTWAFDSAANPAGPETSSNTYGVPQALVTVGAFGSGWIADGLGVAVGYWDLGMLGDIALTIPNQAASPPQSYKFIAVQVTEWNDGGLFQQLATVSVPGATLLEARTNVVAPTMFGRWIRHETKWRVDTTGSVESILVTAPDDGAIIDQVAVETIVVAPNCPPGVLGCGGGWDFDPPTPGADLCSAGSVQVAVVGTVTNRAGFCGGSYEITRTWSATDICGNRTLCSQTVTVVDRTPPALICAPAKSVECGGAWDFDPPAAAFDFCGQTDVLVAVVETVTNRAGFCGGTYEATRTWTATDACGNSISCSQTVTVVDTTAPTIVCSDVTTCNPHRPINPSVMDACDPAPLVSCTRGDGQSFTSAFPLGTTLVTCSASDACGNSASCQFQVTVTEHITAVGPVSLTVRTNHPAALQTAVAGPGPVTYAWRFDGEVIPGESGDALIVPSATLDQAGTYCVEITGPCNSVTNCAMLNVVVEYCTLTQGAYGNADGGFAGVQTSTLLTNLIGANPLVLGNSVTRSLTIELPDIPLLVSRLPAGGVPAVLPDLGEQFLGTATVPLTSKGKFDNLLLGQAIALALNLRLDPPIAGFGLTGQFCMVGGEGTGAFSIPAGVLEALADPGLSIRRVTVGGLSELARRALAGAPTGSATLPDISQALATVNAAFNRCRLFVACPGQIIDPPANDSFAGRTLLNGAATADPATRFLSFRNTTATAEPGEPAHGPSPAAKSLWFQLTPTQDGWVRLRTAGSSFDTVLAVYTGQALNQLTPVASNDDMGSEVWSEILFYAAAGVPYQIAVDGFAGVSGDVDLTISENVTP